MLLPVSLNDFDFNVAGFSSTSASTSPYFLLFLSALISLVLFVFIRTAFAVFAWYSRPPIQLRFDYGCESVSPGVLAAAANGPLKNTTTPGQSEKVASDDLVPSSTAMNDALVSKPPFVRRWCAAFLPSRQAWEQFTSSLPVNFSLLSSEGRTSKSLGRGVGVVEGGLRTNAVATNATISERPRQWNKHTSGPTFEPPVPAIYQTDVPASMAKIILSRHTFRRPSPAASRRPSSPSALPRNVIS